MPAPRDGVPTSDRLDPNAVLTGVPLLAALDRGMLEELTHLGTLQQFPKHSVLFNELDEGDSLHVVLSGYVQVLTTSASGREIELALLGPGEALGELSVLDGLPRGGTAIADTDVATLAIDRERFLRWLGQQPDAAIALLASLSAKIRRTSAGASDLVALGLQARLSKRLLMLARREQGGRIIVTQQELARSLGVTREAVNKELRSLEERGIVELSRGRVMLLDQKWLERTASNFR